MTHETEQHARWAVSETTASTPPKRGRLYTKGIDFDLSKGAAGHIAKIEIHDRDPKEAERLAVIIAECLNSAEAVRDDKQLLD